MTNAKGYMGKILMVDLSTSTFTEQEISDTVYEKFLSGSGLGAFVLYNSIPAAADPLGPDNVLGFVSGILTGTGSLFTGRWMVVGKSPLTGGYGEANCGGNFSPAIKRCGYDGIFFKGISKKPVYLHIKNDKIELKDAAHIWGMDAIATEEKLIQDLTEKQKPKVACIGPAGEKLSCISGISNDLGRMAARSGLGAVMGSKRLKAVVLDGNVKIQSHDRSNIRILSQKCQKLVNFQPWFISGKGVRILGAVLRFLPIQTAMDGMLWKIMLRKWGTIALNQYSSELGDAPLKNWSGSNIDFAKEKSSEFNPDRILASQAKRYHCYSCPLGCGGICKGDFPNGESHKPEYESVLALSGLCLNGDLESVYQMNDRLNRAGMDTISAGGILAFAIECFERGILTKEDTDGLVLEWGNSQSMMALLEKIIAREGIGDILADGVKKAAAKIGKQSEQYAIHAGGQELPMHDSRFDPGLAVHYAVEAMPGRHTIGSQLFYEMFRLWKKDKSLPGISLVYRKKSKYKVTDTKAVQSAACSKFTNVLNGAGGCIFGAQIGVDRVPFFEWLNAATGWRKTPAEYLAIGKRLQTLKQAFNLKHGIEPKSTWPNPKALGDPPLVEGANRQRTVELNRMIEDYWYQFGWSTRTGEPVSEEVSAFDTGV